MAEKHYDWADGEIPFIEAHSLAKHRILRRYIEIYVEVLMSNPKRERLALTLVDGFAGGGVYRQRKNDELHFGSPLILLRTVPVAEANVNRSRKKQVIVDARYEFVEKNSNTVAYLRRTIAEHCPTALSQGRVHVREGVFEDELDSIIRQISQRGRKPRAIFILDQYGYSDVPLAAVQRIFESLPNAEVFMTLAVGWISAYLSQARDAVGYMSRSMGIDECPLTVAEIEALYLQTDDESRRKQLFVQRILYETFAKKAGAAFFTPFFIMSRGSNRPYWFLHLANNWRANNEVKKLHWSLENHFEHYGGPGTNMMMLGYDPHRDGDLLAQGSFDFGSTAEKQTRAALHEDIPKRVLKRHPDGISFRQLFEATTNEMPGTESMLADVVSELVRRGDLAKIGGAGEMRRPGTRAHHDDIIRPRGQKYFDFIKDPKNR
ncbi:MAG: three-Cys-motif partner protein TcmP [Proteobacteria bacterium]|nr:three-Cys-motif partner protein TcmP [Pseudomonadota bacterium]